VGFYYLVYDRLQKHKREIAESTTQLQAALVGQGTIFKYLGIDHTVMGSVPESNGSWWCEDAKPRSGSEKKLFIDVKVIIDGIDYM
jgi:hypothetical protein